MAHSEGSNLYNKTCLLCLLLNIVIPFWRKICLNMITMQSLSGSWYYSFGSVWHYGSQGMAVHVFEMEDNSCFVRKWLQYFCVSSTTQSQCTCPVCMQQASTKHGMMYFFCYDLNNLICQLAEMSQSLKKERKKRCLWVSQDFGLAISTIKAPQNNLHALWNIKRFCNTVCPNKQETCFIGVISSLPHKF